MTRQNRFVLNPGIYTERHQPADPLAAGGAGWDWVADGDTPSLCKSSHPITTEKIYQDHNSRILERDGISDSLPGFQANSSQESQYTHRTARARLSNKRGAKLLQTLQAIGPGDWQRAAHLEPHLPHIAGFLMQRASWTMISEQTGRLVKRFISARRSA